MQATQASASASHINITAWQREFVNSPEHLGKKTRVVLLFSTNTYDGMLTANEDAVSVGVAS